jgi:peptide/nickel transport system permease protein
VPAASPFEIGSSGISVRHRALDRSNSDRLFETTCRPAPSRLHKWPDPPDSGRPRVPLIAGLTVVTLFCLIAVFADFLAPYDYRAQSRRELLAPPTALHFRTIQGSWHLRPFIHARGLVDPVERRYAVDLMRVYPLELFTRGYSYRLLGLFTFDRHLFGVRSIEDTDAPRAYLLGADALGRDRLSRLLIASRFSL